MLAGIRRRGGELDSARLVGRHDHALPQEWCPAREVELEIDESDLGQQVSKRRTTKVLDVPARPVHVVVLIPLPEH